MAEMDGERYLPETQALRHLEFAMATAEAALGRRMRMHPTDLAAMNHLSWAREPMGPGDLAQRLGISPAAATELVDRLTVAGHVERHRDLSDRRRVRLEPSTAAMDEVRGHLDALTAALDDAARVADPAERAAILAFLRRAADTFLDWADPERD